MSRIDDQTQELWREFMPRRDEVQGRVNELYYSLQDYSMLGGKPPSPSDCFDKWAAVQVLAIEHVPAGMRVYSLSGGQYAVFKHRGPAADFQRTFRMIFEEWLPNSAYSLDAREHFELLGPEYRPDDPNAEEEIWIPIRAAEPGDPGQL